MSEWKEVRLGDVGKIVGGATPSTRNPQNYGGVIPWITPKDLSINKERFIEFGERNISEQGLNSCSAKMLPKGSILFSSRAPIGYVAIAHTSLCTNQGFKSFVPDTEKMDSMFSYYLLKHNSENIANLGSGTTFMEVSGKVMSDYIVNIPDLSTQQEIAGILSSLDTKIETNNKLNEKLEEMAQAIFKSWFVDFEPFKDKPFHETELGMIPEGWEVVSLDELTSKFGTGLNPRKNFVLGHGNNYYVTIKNMNNNRIYLDEKCDKVDDEALLKINARSKLKKGDLLFSGIGTIGRVAMVNEEPKIWNTSESVFNMHPSELCTSEFLYVLLLSDVFQKFVKMNALGAVQQGIRMASLKSYKIAIPGKKVMLSFCSIIKPIVDYIQSNNEENDRLASLRDTLLPRLMSGELIV